MLLKLKPGKLYSDKKGYKKISIPVDAEITHDNIVYFEEDKNKNLILIRESNVKDKCSSCKWVLIDGKCKNINCKESNNEQ